MAITLVGKGWLSLHCRSKQRSLLVIDWTRRNLQCYSKVWKTPGP